MEQEQVAVRSDLDRYTTRLLDGCRKNIFSEVHMALMKAKGWMDYEEPTPVEFGYWLGAITVASQVATHRESAELLRRYARELREQLKPGARTPKASSS